MQEQTNGYTPIDPNVKIKDMNPWALILFNPEKRKVKVHPQTYQQFCMSKRKGSIH